MADRMASLEKMAHEFLPFIREHVKSCRDENRSYWIHLEYHSEYIRRLGKALFYLAAGEREEAGKYWSEFCTFLQQHEIEFQECVDVYRVIEVGQHYTGF